jgi:hypothetical protein
VNRWQHEPARIDPGEIKAALQAWLRGRRPDQSGLEVV